MPGYKLETSDDCRYEVTKTKYTRKLREEVLLAAAASVLLVSALHHANLLKFCVNRRAHLTKLLFACMPCRVVAPCFYFCGLVYMYETCGATHFWLDAAIH